ncbi:MAG: tripartite tricarboxylate transporter substrate binding protein [Burkholderiales bacterium]|nr:tripartite tricarboxylate transporter substrate binding protein [Burkholderiales bacterium]
MRHLTSAIMVSATALMATAHALFAQPYPSRPVRVIDGYPPGGTTDIVARTIAPRFLESQGQPWVVENRAGAQGIIATDMVARSAPDGYTLLMFTGGHAVHPSIYKNLPYDLMKAFAPVTWTSDTTNVLIAHPSVPVRTVKDLIALAKAQPGRLNFSSGGVGSPGHVAMELLKNMAGIDMKHIPYKGGTPAVLDIVAGHVDLGFGTLPVAHPHVRSGRLRAIAVASPKRSLALPEVSTVAEAGLPGFEAGNATGVLAPAGTPREVIAKLQQEIARILKLPEVRERLLNLGTEPVGSTPEQFGDYLRTQIAKWAKVVKATGMELQAW